jgi:hypothetical protein
MTDTTETGGCSMTVPASLAYPRNPAAKKPFDGTEERRVMVRRVKPALGSQLALFAMDEYDLLSPTAP